MLESMQPVRTLRTEISEVDKKGTRLFSPQFKIVRNNVKLCCIIGHKSTKNDISHNVINVGEMRFIVLTTAP